MPVFWKTWRFILLTSITSRLLVLGLQYLSNQVINTHDSDAYKNRYHLMLQRSDINLHPCYGGIYHLLKGFTRWDAQYFLKISLDNYTCEQHTAFFPLLPYLIRNLRDIVPIHCEDLISVQEVTEDQEHWRATNLQAYIESVSVCFVANNFILFPGAALALHRLTEKIRGGDENYARRVTLWFCFNPASVFFSSCYSESLFAFLVFTGLNLLEVQNTVHHSRGETRSSKKNGLTIASSINLAKACMPASILFWLAGLTRSNGMLLVGYVGHQVLYRHHADLMDYLKRKSKSTNFLVRLILDSLVVLLLIIGILTAYILYQLRVTREFCNYDSTDPEWCQDILPHPYSYVQKKYWSVGFLKYASIKQIHNFMLATPVVILVMNGLREYYRSKHKIRELPYHIHALVLILLGLLVAHAEILTRLLTSSCPVIYWYCADMKSQSRKKTRFLICYFAAYFIIGTMVHTTFYPWT